MKADGANWLWFMTWHTAFIGSDTLNVYLPCGCNPAQMPQNPHSPIDGYFRARAESVAKAHIFSI